MRFEDEPYVRVYTRNTPTLKLVGWQGRAVLWEVMRACDRAGLLDVGDDAVEAVVAATDLPAEVVAPGLAALVKRKVVTINVGVLLLPRFIEGQTAKQSDRARKAKEREMARAVARKSGPGPVTVGADGRVAPGPHEPTVYFVQAASGGPIKIGTTADLRQRLWALTTGRSDQLTLLGLTPGGLELESDIHDRFAHLRTKGEWFSPDSSLLSFIEVTCRDSGSHAESHGVRWSHSELSVAERSEAKASENTHTSSAPARSNPGANHPGNPERSGEPKSAQDAFKRPTVEAPKHPAVQTPKSPPEASQAPGSDPLTADVWAALRAHDDLTPVATWDLASRIAGRAHAAGRPVAWLAVAISDAAREAGARAGIGQPFDTGSLASLVTRYCDRAKAPFDGKASGTRFRRPEDIKQGEWSMSDAERARVAEQDRARPVTDDDLEAFLADLPADEAEAMRKALKVAS